MRQLEHHLLVHQLLAPVRFDQLGGELRDAAWQVRGRRSALRGAAGQLRWQSRAAGEFQLALARPLGQFGRLADRLDELADAVIEHGTRASRRGELVAGELRSAERLATDWLTGGRLERPW